MIFMRPSACTDSLIDPDIVHPVTPAMIAAPDSDNEIAIPCEETIPKA